MNDKLPKGWVWTNLEDISEIILGQSPPSSTYNEDGNGLSFYQGKLEFGKIYPTPRKWCTAPRKIAEKGDVLISVRAPVGPNNICPETSCIGRGLAAIRGLGGIDPFFLLYLMRAFENVIAGKGTGTTFKAITGNQLRGFRIPLPPLPEQHRIVAKIEELLTKLDAGVESLKKAKAHLKHYCQAVLKAAMEGKLTKEWREAHKDELESASVLLERIREERKKSTKKYIDLPLLYIPDLPELPEGWVWTLLDNLMSDNPRNGLYKSIEFFDESLGVRLLDIKGLYKGFNVDFQGSRRAKLNKEEIEKYSLAESDLLINRVSKKPEGVGKAALVKNLGELTVFESNMIRIKLNNYFVYPYFINYFLNSKDGRTQILKKAKMTQQASINQGDIKSIIIPLPPIVEQHYIVEEVERRLSIADEIEATIKANLKRAEHLRQSILKQAFLGKLVPQDPNDEPASILLERIKEEKVKRELEAQRKSRVISRSKNDMEKVKRDAGGEKQTVDLCDILRLAKKPLEPKELWLSSELDIEDFYAQLKEEVVKKERIIEHRPNDTDVFLELRI